MPAETVTLVTGAASGIGRATVEHLIHIGGRVVAVDRSADSMDWLDKRSACAVVGDVTDEATNHAAVVAAQERFGGLDAAFLNAGLSVSGPLETLDLARFDECLDVNLRAVVLGLRAVVPALRQRGGGAVVVNASVTALGGEPGRWPYAAAKAAALNLVRSAAIDFAGNVIARAVETLSDAVSSGTGAVDRLGMNGAVNRDGTPARLEMLISMTVVSQFLRAYSSR